MDKSRSSDFEQKNTNNIDSKRTDIKDNKDELKFTILFKNRDRLLHNNL